MPPKSILVDVTIFSALVAGLPELFGETPPVLTKSVNGLLHSAEFKADNVEGKFEIIGATDAHPTMLASAEIGFVDINDNMLTGISIALAETDFDDEIFTGLVLGQSIAFVLVDIDGTALPAGGITFDSIALTAPDLAKVVMTIIDLKPADGTTNLWSTFAEQFGLVDANKMSTTSPHTIMHAEPARTDGATLVRQMAAEIPDMGDDGTESTTQMGDDDVGRQTVAA